MTYKEFEQKLKELVEEQKYYVEFTDGYMLSRNWEDNLEDIEIDCPSKNFLENGGWFYYTFTEAEIKEIDERYWTFAVPVEVEVIGNIYENPLVKESKYE